MCCSNSNCWTGHGNNVRYATDSFLTDTDSIDRMRDAGTGHHNHGSAEHSSHRNSHDVK